MRYTLDTFYQSDAWVKLVQIIKVQRTNDKGEIICEHCGKPITLKYDCIGHHKVHLTEENVNDVNISLNSDNVALVHHRCHNRIHNKLGNCRQEVYLVYGSPFSGKSTWVKGNMNEGDLVVDIDSIWQCVSGCDRYIKPKRLNAIVFGMHRELLEMVKYRRGKWVNAYVIGGYPLIGERERICKELCATEIFIDTDKDKCIERCMNTNDGRMKDEWLKYILDWWSKYAPRCNKS